MPITYPRLYRSVSHKTNYVFITAAHLLCYVAAHPVLKQVWEATFSLSTHNREGSNAFADRVMEGYQNIQTKRSGVNGSFDHMLHMGPALAAMVHVTMTWNETMKDNDSDVAKYIDDPISPGMLVGADALRKALLKVCGTDATKSQRVNPCWHTGPVDADGGDYRMKKPHLWLWAVLAGTSGGKGPPVKDGSELGGYRARAPHEHPRPAESWSKYITRFMQTSMFQV